MARGDALYANCNVDWITDPRCFQLDIHGRWLNHCLWLTAVKERRETLPKNYNLKYFSRISQISEKKCKVIFSTMIELELIKVEENVITVIGVKACHKKLKWRDSPQVPHTGTERGHLKGEREREKEKESNKENFEVSDLPVSKPDPKPDLDFKAVEDLAFSVATGFHSGESVAVVKPQILNFLGQGVDLKTIRQAVLFQMDKMANVDDRRFRPKFRKVFPDIASVADMVTEAEMVSQNVSGAKLERLDGVIAGDIKIDPKTRHKEIAPDMREHYEKSRLSACLDAGIDPDYHKHPKGYEHWRAYGEK